MNEAQQSEKAADNRLSQRGSESGSGVSGPPPTETGPSGLEGCIVLFAGLKMGRGAGGGGAGGTDAASGRFCKAAIFAVSASI
ncbi:hypothetical protein ACVWYH_006217 [Bradyrhizobium sp. GM24.11]